MWSNYKKYTLFSTGIFLLPAIAFGAPTSQEAGGNYNIFLVGLVALMLVLLFIIGMLADTLYQLTFAVRDKIGEDKDKKEIAGAVKTLLLLLLICTASFQSVAAEVTTAAKGSAAPVSDFIGGIAKNDYYAIMAMIAFEIAVIFALVLYVKMLLRAIANKPEMVPLANHVIRKSWFWDKFNAAAPVEKEKDILLDHNYDGIQELDNSLPPWWKYGFYLTIVVAAIYLYRFHVSHDGLSQEEEYVAEMQKGEEDKAAYLAKSANNVDENTVTLLTDPAELAAGKEVFIKTCAPCHMADGGGNVGPNLTDEYWLHGGSIKDIFKTIKYGWQDKGMKSWKDDFSPKQIQELASFVKSLKGSHPATPKAPQGDLYIEAGQKTATDSTKTDSAKTRKVVLK
jgi:cytochrome c oxidase cbb3-type subunit 3